MPRKGYESTAPFRKRFDQLYNEADRFRSHWYDIQQYVFPHMGRWLAGQKGDETNDGSKKRSNIINNIGERSNRTLAAGMQGGLTSPSRPWYRLTIADRELAKQKDVRIWLEEVRKVLAGVFAKSNFYGALHSAYEELSAFGTAVLLIENDPETVVRYKVFTIGEYYLGLDARGIPDSLYRRFEMTPVQLVEEYGKENVSPHVLSMLDKGQTQEKIRVIHAIQPRAVRDITSDLPTNMAYESVHFEEGSDAKKNYDDDKFLRISGYRSKPFLGIRWDVYAGDTYGYCPAMEALPDVKQLNKMEEKKLKAMDKMVDPPMNAPTSLKKVGASVIPGAVNYYDSTQGGQGFTPAYQVNPDIQGITYGVNEVMDRIRSTFYNDLFLMIAQQDQRMTATEVAARQEEKMAMLGPVIERFQNEGLDPLIDRTFEKALAYGLIPPPPPSLQGRELEVEYISVLAQAQKMVNSATTDRFLASVGQAAQFKPEILDKLDGDAIVDEYHENFSASPKLLLDAQEVDALRQQRAAQQQAAQMAAMAQPASDMAKAAKDLSQTNVTEESALSMLTEGIT